MTWRSIEDGVWSAEKRTPQGWSLQTIAVRIGDDELLVVSPTRGLGNEAHQALTALGRPAALLAPNFYHHLGLREWTERYPDATVHASALAAPRVANKSGIAVDTLDALRARLPDGVTALEPDGTRAGEVWLEVATRRGRAWIASDAFFNVAESPTGLMGWVLRRTGTVPGLRIGWTFLKLGLRDRRAYRRWLDERLETAPPALLIVAHGEPYAAPDLADRLRDLSQTRLPR